MRKFLLIVAGLLVALVVVIIVLPRVIGLNSFKPQIADAVREATGRELRIGGDVDLAVLPGLTLRLSDVTLSNPDWAEAPNLMTLDSAELDMSLLPLVTGELVVDRLVISDPALFLEQDAQGRASWDFTPTAKEETAPSEERAPGDEGDGLPFSEIRLGDVRLENGSLSYANRATGQEVIATPINVTVALPNIDSRLTVEGRLTVNGEPVSLDVAVETPGQAMREEPFEVTAQLGSALIQAGYVGRVQAQPVPGLDGRFELDIGSVGRLAAWLDQPLAEGQPDPGPLTVSADFTADGRTAVLEQATIDGEALQATANGRIDASGEITKVTLAVESGMLNIDRYLPPPAPAADRATEPSEPTESAEPPGDLLAGLSDEPLDLSALRQSEADVTITLAGIKAGGYEVGRLSFVTTLKDSLLNADLQELALYGGNITGHLGLDASGEALAADAALTVDQVDVGALARVGSPEEPPVGGVASAQLEATAEGVSPRALAASLQGRLGVDLGGLQSAQTAAISDLKLEAILPGLEAAPSMTADLVYNEEPVNLQLGLAPLPEMMSGEPFALDLKVASALVTAGYEGTVQQQPVPGLDGRFDLDVGSVGKLAAWLGQPLPADQPDPGPLKLAATFAADGAQVGLSEATLEGKAVKARAEGSFDRSGEVAKFQARLAIDELNADAYLPPPAEEEKAEAPAPGESGGEPGPAGAEGWSEEPIELGPLQMAEGDVQVTTGPVTYRGLVIEKSSALATLEGGVLNFDLTELSLAEGAVAAKATLDGSGPAAALTYEASVEGVQAKPLLSAFSGIDWLSGTMVFNAKGSASGRNQKELVGALNGDGAFEFLDGAVEGVNIAKTLRQAGKLGMGGDDGETPKTDFSELSGSFVITDGLLENQDLTMLAPLLRLSGAGKVPLPERTIDYLAEAKLVGTLEGQGGQEALAGLPIPIRIEGPWSNVSYNIDWESVLQQAAADPQRLMQMPDDLKEAAKGFGVDLPIPGGEGLGETLKNIPGLPSQDEEGQDGSGSGEGAVESLQRLIKPDGGESSQQAPAEQQEEKPAEKPLDSLKNLFNN